MANSESTNPQTETDLIGNFQEEALAQLLQLAEDVTLRVGKLSSEFNMDKEMIVQALGLKLPIYAHRLKKHKPTAWSEALAGMVKDAPPEVRKGSGEKQFNGSYAKWVSGNWMDRKDEFEEKAWLKDTGYRIGSERAGCRSLLDALERQCGYTKQGEIEIMCVAVSKKHDLNICYASSQLVLEYLTLLGTKGLGWRDFALYIRGGHVFTMIKESEENTKRSATACTIRNERRKVVRKQILDRINAQIPVNGGLRKLPRLPRRKGALRKALIEHVIGCRTPNSWSNSESALSLDDIEVLLQSTKDSDLKMVEAALTTDAPDESLRFIAM